MINFYIRNKYVAISDCSRLTLIISAVCGVFLLPVLMAWASPLAALLPLYLMLALMSHFVSCTVLSLCEIPVWKFCALF